MWADPHLTGPREQPNSEMVLSIQLLEAELMGGTAQSFLAVVSLQPGFGRASVTKGIRLFRARGGSEQRGPYPHRSNLRPSTEHASLGTRH